MDAQSFEGDAYLALPSPPMPGEFLGTLFVWSLSFSPLKIHPQSLLLVHLSSEEQDTSMVHFISFQSSPRVTQRYLSGSPKRRKVSADAYKSGSYSPTKTKKKRHANSKPSSPEDLETRVKIGLPHRTLSTPSTPVSHGGGPLSKPSSFTKDAGPDVQMVHRSVLVPSSPSPFVDATSGRGQPWPLVANNGKYRRYPPSDPFG